MHVMNEGSNYLQSDAVRVSEREMATGTYISHKWKRSFNFPQCLVQCVYFTVNSLNLPKINYQLIGHLE